MTCFTFLIAYFSISWLIASALGRALEKLD